MPCASTPNCTVLPEIIAADPDIAGIGIIVSFAISGGLTVLAVTLWLLTDLFDAASKNELLPDDPEMVHFVARWVTRLQHSMKAGLKSNWLVWFNCPTRFKIMRTLESLILGFSDQQLVIGIALLATAQVKICDISKYHYETTLLLATISSGVHTMTLITLREYLLKNSAVWVFRVLGTIVHSTLTLVMVIKILNSAHDNLQANARWPLRCFYSSKINKNTSFITPREGYPSGLITFILIVNIIAIVSPSMLLAETKTKNRPTSEDRAEPFEPMASRYSFAPTLAIRGLSLLVFIFTSISFILYISWVFKVRAEMKPYLERSEDDWSFGQIAPNLMLIIVLYQALEAFTGMLIYFDSFLLSVSKVKTTS
ncbi:hypothetical protein GGR58DRAFT_495002 [Xylaria digitata]|nr:hypothetical protein GGR58DRAFT_495002 [Xylaria digitata]